MLNQWDLLEADFQSEYGLDVVSLLRKQTWRWFAVRVSGLFAVDSRLARYFQPDSPEEKSPIADE